MRRDLTMGLFRSRGFVNGVLLAAVLLAAGCADELPEPRDPGDDPLSLFSKNGERTIQAACAQVERLCTRRGGNDVACLAYDLVCGETEEESCAKLARACESMATACLLHDRYCSATPGPLPDAGVPAADTSTPPPPPPDAAAPLPDATTPPPPDSGVVPAEDAATPEPDVGVIVPPTPTVGVWISAAELAQLPMSGEAWDALKKAADASLPADPNLSARNVEGPHVMAKALVFARTGEPSYRQEVIDAVIDVMGTEGGDALATFRGLGSYVIAADLVGLPASTDQAFRAWLTKLLEPNHLVGSRSVVGCHEDRPNNWGTHAGASRAAAARYLGDTAEVARAAAVFKGWLGDRSAYAEFKYGDLSWQADPSKPVGINPVGATIDGHPVDGVIPDDQRRCGSFQWPPCLTNYAWEGLQGALAQAVILHRAGYDVWNWENKALLRAVRWLHDHAAFPAEGDDTWQPHVINHYYGTNFPAPMPSRHGKAVGWTCWTHP